VPPPLPRQPSTPVLPSSALPIEAAPASGASLSDANYRVQSVVRQTSSEPSDSRQPLTALGRARIKFGTPQDLRNAIVLREIFGPPRSLQSGDLTSSL
jgi:hypothetical protein